MENSVCIRKSRKQEYEHMRIPEWYSGSCLTVVTSTQSGSRQLQSEPEFSPKGYT